MITPTTAPEPLADADPDDPTGRLATFVARTRTPLDLLALATLWIVLVPPGDFGAASTVALVVRLGLSAVYAIDITIRATLARRHWHYVRHNWLSLVVVVFPPVRVIFSVRLLQSVFRRGNLERFLLAASVLVLNGAIVVYLFERDAKGSNIHTLGQSVWWAVTTVSTVGYGDYYPVTAGGKIAASLIMAIAILTLAVVTAQVAASFMDQTRARVSADPPPTADISMAEVVERLARIEALLTTTSPRTD
ncbi:MAG TPA: ion channel [Acidimicrobiia bacterium]|nr:ion channel [Acidimicrobiia bacterium]